MSDNVCTDPQKIFISQFLAMYGIFVNRGGPIESFKQYPFSSFEKFCQINKCMRKVFNRKDDLEGYDKMDMLMTLQSIDRIRLFKSDYLEITETVESVYNEGSYSVKWIGVLDKAMSPTLVSADYRRAHINKTKEDWKKLVCRTENTGLKNNARTLEQVFNRIWASCEELARDNDGSGSNSSSLFYLMRMVDAQSFNKLNKKLNNFGRCLHIEQAVDFLFDLQPTSKTNLKETRVFKTCEDCRLDIERNHRLKNFDFDALSDDQIMTLSSKYRLSSNPTKVIKPETFLQEVK